MTLDYMDTATAIDLRGLGTLDADEVCCLHAIDQQALLDSLNDDELGALGAAAKKKKGQPAKIKKKPGQSAKPPNAAQQAQMDRMREQLAKRAENAKKLRQQLQQKKTAERAAKTAADEAQAAARRAQNQLAQRTKVNQKLRAKNQGLRANNATMREAIASSPLTLAQPTPAVDPGVPVALPDDLYMDAGFRPGVVYDPWAAPQDDWGYPSSNEADFSMFDGAPIVDGAMPAAPWDQYQGDAFGWADDAGGGWPEEQEYAGEEWGEEQYDDTQYFTDDWGDEQAEYDGDPALGSWLSKAFKKVTGTKLSNVTGSIAGSVPVVGGILQPIIEGVNRAGDRSGSGPSTLGPVIPPPPPAPAPKPKARTPAFWLALAGLGVGAIALMGRGRR